MSAAFLKLSQNKTIPQKKKKKKKKKASAQGKVQYLTAFGKVPEEKKTCLKKVVS